MRQDPANGSNAESREKRPSRLGEQVRSEIVGILSLLACLFTAAALFTFDASDPSWNSVTSGDTAATLPHNAMGYVGAMAADVLVQMLGLAAFLLPVAAGVYAVRYMALRPIRYAGWVAAGYGAFILCSAGLAGLITGEVALGGEKFYAGGVSGKVLGDVFTRLFNRPGAYLFLSAGFLVTLLFTANFSLVRFADRLRLLLLSLWRRVREKMILLRERRAKSVAYKAERGRERPSKTYPKIVAEEPEAPPRPRPAIQESFGFVREVGGYKLPPPEIFEMPQGKKTGPDQESLVMASKQLLKKLQDFGIEGEVETVRPGPVVTMFEFKPAPGVKINRIVNLSDDLALALRAHSIRIVAPIPGKDTVGVEIPNMSREMVTLGEVFDSPAYRQSESPLTIALGKDISGNPVVADLGKMPHLLIAGATGSGKSVAVHSMIASLLNRASPRDVKLLIVDPKMLELSVYDGIPHLLLPVVTEAKKASLALRWAVAEMERRYRLMAEEGVRNIAAHNKKIEKRIADRQAGVGEGACVEHLPFIVVVIDELADLMMVSSKEVEESIARLAQMARAAGIHLIVATQRPSVDVITGMIKANFPARIAFQVASRVDSRTILDSMGAEALLGGGDMLFLPPGTAKLQRVHGSYVSEGEIAKLVEFLRAQGEPQYDESILEEREEGGFEDDGGEYDDLYDHAVAFVAEGGQASVSMVQRKFKIGYNRAARMIERMEREGVVGPSRGAKPREVLVRRV